MSIFDLMALPWRLQGAMAGYAAGAQRHTCRSCGLPESNAGHFRHHGEWLCVACWRMYLKEVARPRCTRCGHPGAAYSESGPVLCGTCQGERYQEARERVAAACPQCPSPEAPAPAITDGQLRAALLRDLEPAATVQVRDADGSWICGDSQS